MSILIDISVRGEFGVLLLSSIEVLKLQKGLLLLID